MNCQQWDSTHTIIWTTIHYANINGYIIIDGTTDNIYKILFTIYDKGAQYHTIPQILSTIYNMGAHLVYSLGPLLRGTRKKYLVLEHWNLSKLVYYNSYVYIYALEPLF